MNLLRAVSLMRRLRALPAPGVVALACASSNGPADRSDSPLQGPANGSGSDAAAEASVGQCDDTKQSLVQLINQNRSCSGDTDCQTLVSFCLFEGRVQCAGHFFMNNDVDPDEFTRLDGELTECVGGVGHGCGTCLGGPNMVPICKDGVCMPDPVECNGFCYVPGDPDYDP